MSGKVLVDTSVWIEHLKKPINELNRLLNQHSVLVHPSVVGELACGHLPNRVQFIQDLQLMQAAPEASQSELLQLIQSKKLFGRGLGWVDIQLLASAALVDAELWTLDKKLLRHSKY